MAISRVGGIDVVEVDGERLSILDSIITRLHDYCDFAVTKDERSRPDSLRQLLEDLRAARNTIPRDLEIRRGDDARPGRQRDIEAIAKAVNALYMAVWSRLLFLRGARGLAKERSMLLEDIVVIEAAVPTTEQLERIERNRRYLERCVDYKLRQIERVRALRNQGKRSKIKSVA